MDLDNFFNNNDDIDTSAFINKNKSKQNGDTPTDKNVYHIVEIFKGYNYKLFSNEKYGSFEENELNAFSLDFNAGFGDLRISLYNIEKDNLKHAKTSIFLPFKSRVAEACVRLYPENAIKIIKNKNTGTKIDIKERRFDFEKAFEPNISEIIWKDNNIHVETYNPGKKVKYIFNFFEEQIDMFDKLITKINDCEFVNMSMISKIFKMK
jgi:hypothetical protein